MEIADLFEAGDQLRRITMPDAEVYYLRSLALGRPIEVVLRRLMAETPWRQEKVFVWGKHYQQPRLIAWYGDPGIDYSYSGITLNPLPWTDLMLDIRNRVEAVAGTQFNSVLLNYYRNHRDSMGFHSDDEPELGRKPVIASLSLGEERSLILKHKFNRALIPKRLRLASGSLLLMKGDTQRYWTHGIARETQLCGPRVNLTFRRIVRPD